MSLLWFLNEPIPVLFPFKEDCATADAEPKLMMKFVERYGVRAHQLLANAGWLVFCWTVNTMSGT